MTIDQRRRSSRSPVRPRPPRSCPPGAANARPEEQFARRTIAVKDVPTAVTEAAAKELPGVDFTEAWKNVDADGLAPLLRDPRAQRQRQDPRGPGRHGREDPGDGMTDTGVASEKGTGTSEYRRSQSPFSEAPLLRIPSTRQSMQMRRPVLVLAACASPWSPPTGRRRRNSSLARSRGPARRTWRGSPATGRSRRRSTPARGRPSSARDDAGRRWSRRGGSSSRTSPSTPPAAGRRRPRPDRLRAGVRPVHERLDRLAADPHVGPPQPRAVRRREDRPARRLARPEHPRSPPQPHRLRPEGRRPHAYPSTVFGINPDGTERLVMELVLTRQ